MPMRSHGIGVVVVGSFNVDHVWTLDALPAPGETRAGRYASGPGGKDFNQADAPVSTAGSTIRPPTAITNATALRPPPTASTARAPAAATHETARRVCVCASVRNGGAEAVEHGVEAW